MKDKKVTSLILVLVLVIAIVASGTFAYWQWITSTAQETLVNVSLTDDATIYIDFPENEITEMYPTSDCEANGTSSWVTDITVNNGTGVLMATNFKLKVKIEDKDGNVITNGTNEWNSNPFRYYIKYAVTEENESCQNALITGRFDNNVLTYGNVASTDPKYSQRNDWYDSKSITKDGSDGFPLVSSRIGSGVAFHAHPNTSTSHTYKVWVWLDEEYKSVTVGNDSTIDKMQDAKVTVSWSENSELEQVKQTAPQGEAVAIYSEDDNSLRFYRDNNPSSISIGSTYNGRTVTDIYRNVENSANWINETYYYDDELPDGSICDFTNEYYDDILSVCYYNKRIKNVVFEDYIYPINAESWFSNFNLDFIDVTKLKISNLTNLNFMFKKAAINKIVGLESWNTSGISSMGEMFLSSSIAHSIDLSNWNVCDVTNYEGFSQSENITEPNFGHPRLCQGDVKGEAYAVYSETDQSLRFYRSETPITVGSTYNGKVVTNVWTDFENKSSIPENSPWYQQISNGSLNYIVFEDYIYPLNTRRWFLQMGNIGSFDLTKLDTSNVTDMQHMFSQITVSSLDVSHFNTSKVTNMNGVFYICDSITSLDLSNWDTSNVTDMGNMFAGSTALVNVNLEGWDTSNVTNMNAMFMGCGQIANLDVSLWNVCRVTQYNTFSTNNNIIEPNWGMACPE